MMRIGLGLPQLGALAEEDAIRVVAIEAERAGYDSLWAIDRLLSPIAPRSRYPGTPDGSLPPEQHRVLDPIGVLGLAAAVTDRVRLGTNVLVAPWYPPVLLARSLTTLDRLSHGRLDVGLGLGWSQDEYEAVGVPQRDLGARSDELLDVLDAVWTRDIVEHHGRFVRIAPSTIEPKPFQSRPPVLLAAFTPAGLDRVARRADGWIPVGIPADALVGMWAMVRQLAADHGRDPASLRLVVRANVHVTDVSLASDRAPFVGSIPQIAGDLDAARELGAHEVVVDLHADARRPEELLELADRITARALAA
jgi:probable F420-dependent oxidoreductase